MEVADDGHVDRATMCGTARGRRLVVDGHPTSSLPARQGAHLGTVPSMSAVSVLVMDWTTTGRALPTGTSPTWTVTVLRR